jgi:hypothetical protein
MALANEETVEMFSVLSFCTKNQYILEKYSLADYLWTRNRTVLHIFLCDILVSVSESFIVPLLK